MYEYVVNDLRGNQIYSENGFKTEDEAMSAGIEYINMHDIWDCNIEARREGERR